MIRSLTLGARGGSASHAFDKDALLASAQSLEADGKLLMAAKALEKALTVMMMPPDILAAKKSAISAAAAAAAAGGGSDHALLSAVAVGGSSSSGGAPSSAVPSPALHFSSAAPSPQLEHAGRTPTGIGSGGSHPGSFRGSPIMLSAVSSPRAGETTTTATAPKTSEDVHQHDDELVVVTAPPGSSSGQPSVQVAAAPPLPAAATPEDIIKVASRFLRKCNEYAVTLLRDDEDTFSAQDLLITALCYSLDPAMLSGNAFAAAISDDDKAKTAAAAVSTTTPGSPTLGAWRSSFSSAYQLNRQQGSPLLGPPPSLPVSCQTEVQKKRMTKNTTNSNSSNSITPVPPQQQQQVASSSSSSVTKVAFDQYALPWAAAAAANNSSYTPNNAAGGDNNTATASSLLLQTRNVFAAITLNNLGCIFRRQKFYNDAVALFRCAASISNEVAPLATVNLLPLLLLLERRAEAVELGKLTVKKLTTGAGGGTGADTTFRDLLLQEPEVLGLSQHALAMALEVTDGKAAMDIYATAVSGLQAIRESRGALAQHALEVVEHNAKAYESLIRKLQGSKTNTPPPPPTPPASASTAPRPPSADVGNGISSAVGGNSATASRPDGSADSRRAGQQQTKPRQHGQAPRPSGGAAIAPTASVSLPPANVIPEITKQMWQSAREQGCDNSSLILVAGVDHAGTAATVDEVSLLLHGTPWMVLLDTETITQRIPEDALRSAPSIVASSLSHLPHPPSSSEKEGGGASTTAAAGGGTAGGGGGGSSPLMKTVSGSGRKRSVVVSKTADGSQQPLASSPQTNNTTTTGFLAPPKPVAPLVSSEVFLEEVKKRDDIVSFLASRLTQLLKVEEYHNQRHSAAIRIQWFIRPFIAKRFAEHRREIERKKVRLAEMRRQAAARRIVRFFRRVMDIRQKQREQREQIRLQQRRRREAIVVFQKYTRRWNAVQLLHRLRRRRRNRSIAASQLQRWIRGVLSRLCMTRMRRVEHDAVTTLTQWEVRTHAAKRIQATFRMHRTMIRYLIAIGQPDRALKLDVYRYRTSAAVTIQQHVRGFLTRKWWTPILVPRLQLARNRYQALRLKLAATKVQQHFRAHRVKREWQVRIHAARQRGREKHHQQLQRAMTVAAIKIQVVIRRYLARKRRRERIVETLVNHAVTFSASSSAAYPKAKEEEEVVVVLNGVAQYPLVAMDDDDEEKYFIGVRPRYGREAAPPPDDDDNRTLCVQ